MFCRLIRGQVQRLFIPAKHFVNESKYCFELLGPRRRYTPSSIAIGVRRSSALSARKDNGIPPVR
jgi:hypothetical protein